MSFGKMWQLLMIFFVLYSFSVDTVFCDGDIGPGVWRVLNIQKQNKDHHKVKIEVEQRKINRTHDGFNAKFELSDKFTDKYAVRVEICKHVDGGCKPFQVLTDESLVRFIDKYAKSNREKCLEMAGVDPPDFPLEKGNYEVNNFIFNYDELPSDGMYGSYCAMSYVLQGNEEVGCVEMQLEFKEQDDDNHEDCEDEYDEE